MDRLVKLAFLLSGLLSLPAQLLPQAAPVPPATGRSQTLPEFEVASIKLTDVSTRQIFATFRVYPGGKLELHASTVLGFIYQAFLPIKITGGADWVYNDYYDLEAVPPQTIQPAITDLHTKPRLGDERLRQMLQAVLIQRFQLKYHYDSKTGDVYFLRRGEGPMVLQATKTDAAYATSPSREPVGTPRSPRLRGATMAELADSLGGVFGGPVVDETGLSGAYDFDGEPVAIDPEQKDDLTAPYVAFVKKMNLRIVKGKGEVRYFVIDSIQRPSAN
jgi:uncharacterized protein (TIGR03435 family)